jgi:hypothetical protein
MSKEAEYESVPMGTPPQFRQSRKYYGCEGGSMAAMCNIGGHVK